MDIEQKTDPDTGNVEPWTVSTAYIRNAPMESLWEIGAIHRGGGPWQTLNIHTMSDDPLKTIEYISKAGIDTSYDDGDAHILSQLKLTSDSEVEGRINVNTYNAKVLQALLQGIAVGRLIRYYQSKLHPTATHQGPDCGADRRLQR